MTDILKAENGSKNKVPIPLQEEIRTCLKLIHFYLSLIFIQWLQKGLVSIYIFKYCDLGKKCLLY